jgi:hypothetical protein
MEYPKLAAFSGYIPLENIRDKDLALEIQTLLVIGGFLKPGKVNFSSTREAFIKFKESAYLTGANELGKSTADALLKLAGVGKKKPTTLAERIIAYCEDKQYQIDRNPGEKNIIYIEGMNPDGTLNEDQLNVWNDLRIVIEFKNDKPEIIGCWQATTEPGRYYVVNPINSNGAARIAFGQYRAWQRGTHGNADPHEALIQTGGPVTVHRDQNRDGSRAGDMVESGFFGINQHWGGDSPESDIGRWSAGCQVGRTRQGHREFMKIVKSDPRYVNNSEYVFSSIIIPGDDLVKKYPG